MSNEKLADVLRKELSELLDCEWKKILCPVLLKRIGLYLDEIKAPDAAAAQARSCTCHPDDNPPVPCTQKFAYSECVKAAQAQAHCSEWPSIINEAADVLSDVADMVGGATSKLPSSWRWPLIDELHGAAGQIAAAPQPQAAEPVAWLIEYDCNPAAAIATTSKAVVDGLSGNRNRIVSLYTHPQPAQDAKDAARYRWLRDRTSAIGGDPFICIYAGAVALFNGKQADTQIDAAMAKESGR